MLAIASTGCVQSVRFALKPTFDESARSGVEASLAITAGGEVGAGRSAKQAISGVADLGGGVTPERQGVMSLRAGADYYARLGRPAGSIAVHGGPRFGVRTLTANSPLDNVKSAYTFGVTGGIAPISKALRRPGPPDAAAGSRPPGDHRPQVVFINAGAEFDASIVFDSEPRGGPREGRLVAFGPFVEMINFAPRGDAR